MSLPLAYTLAASGEGSFCGRHSLSNLGHSASYMATSVNQRSQTVLVGPNWWQTEFIFVFIFFAVFGKSIRYIDHLCKASGFLTIQVCAAILLSRATVATPNMGKQGGGIAGMTTSLMNCVAWESESQFKVKRIFKVELLKRWY